MTWRRAVQLVFRGTGIVICGGYAVVCLLFLYAWGFGFAALVMLPIVVPIALLGIAIFWLVGDWIAGFRKLE